MNPSTTSEKRQIDWERRIAEPEEPSRQAFLARDANRL